MLYQKIQRRLPNLAWKFSNVRGDFKFWKTGLWNLFFQIIIVNAKIFTTTKLIVSLWVISFCRLVCPTGRVSHWHWRHGKRRIKCLRKFYMAARKHYNKAVLTSIRATIDRHLHNKPNNKPFSILVDWNGFKIPFHSFLTRILVKNNQICHVSRGYAKDSLHMLCLPLASSFFTHELSGVH